jgi:3-isopropylmalate/(R)-2-methylmalate dehydratase small subunit
MEKFQTFKGITAALNLINIDTDMLIPKQFLKTIKRTGLGKHLFEEMRYDDNGNENPDFVLNREPFRKAQILVGGDNFGCGSSREHAPWALADFGIKVVIAPSFADIFYANCFNIGILPIILPEETVEQLIEFSQTSDDPELEIDLEKQEIRGYGNAPIKFPMDEQRKECLLEGLDSIGLTLRDSKATIENFETARKAAQPWLEISRTEA